jgi:hypothetical protein
MGYVYGPWNLLDNTITRCGSKVWIRAVSCLRINVRKLVDDNERKLFRYTH